MSKVCGSESFYVDKSPTERVWFYPGDPVPAWAAKQVGSHCLDGEDDKTASEDDTSDDDGPPPQSGKGSGRDEWAAYAQTHGVEFGVDDGRDEIIAACADAGAAV